MFKKETRLVGFSDQYEADFQRILRSASLRNWLLLGGSGADFKDASPRIPQPGVIRPSTHLEASLAGGWGPSLGAGATKGTAQTPSLYRR